MENAVYEDSNSVLINSLFTYPTFCFLIVTYIGRDAWKFSRENLATEMRSHGI